MTQHTNEAIEQAAKDWLFGGNEPKQEDTDIFDEFKDFLGDLCRIAREEALRNVPVGFVRQWINEDRTRPNQRLVTNEDIQGFINLALTTPLDNKEV